MTTDLKQHLKVAARQEVEQICQPLFQSFDINSFIYSRVYKNKFWTLTNRTDWIEHFYIDKYALPQPFKSGYYIDLESIGIPLEQINTAREEFNADYWLNIISVKKKYNEVFGFSTYRNNSKILNFYINHRDVLEHFIRYFKEKGKALIENAERYAIKIPDKQPMSVRDNSALINIDEKRQSFLQSTKITRYYVDDHYSTNYLTNREYQCLVYITQGLTAKEISRDMGIAEKTIHYYLSCAAARLSVNSKSELLELFNDFLGRYSVES